MFSKISLILLSICLCGLVQATPISDFAKNVESSVQNLLGVHCMVESVLNLEDAADEFTYQISKSCGADAVKNLATELADTKALMKLTSKVIDTNDDEDICDNSAFDEDTDSDTEASSDCATQLKTQMADLLTSFKTTKKDITNGLKQSYNSAACVKMAMTNFKYFLNSFPQRIETCAELAADA
ncbi:uncharacterized protein LOC119611553 [Lucilia sericata]|uniref:uncharacterized protein LOC119611553 n=1 Tax=Lucilia sericata TaxID=13632 RepID=UPI0018A8106C|nr:uncharacterized protein LOC119611553 [Lucilia sericata]